MHGEKVLSIRLSYVDIRRDKIARGWQVPFRLSTLVVKHNTVSVVQRARVRFQVKCIRVHAFNLVSGSRLKSFIIIINADAP